MQSEIRSEKLYNAENRNNTITQNFYGKFMINYVVEAEER